MRLVTGSRLRKQPLMLVGAAIRLVLLIFIAPGCGSTPATPGSEPPKPANGLGNVRPIDSPSAGHERLAEELEQLRRELLSYEIARHDILSRPSALAATKLRPDRALGDADKFYREVLGDLCRRIAHERQRVHQDHLILERIATTDLAPPSFRKPSTAPTE